MHAGLSELRTMLLDMMEQAFSGGGSDVQANQQLGVNLSNAVRKDGVTIIQNQNIEIFARIVPTMVRAIKLCDALEVSTLKTLEVVHPPVLPPSEPTRCYIEDNRDPIETACEHFYEMKTSWADMQDVMRRRYMDLVVKREGTKSDAARFLNVGIQTMYTIARRRSSEELATPA